MKRWLILFSLLVIGCASEHMTGGKVYMQQQNWDKAIEQFQLEINENPNADAYMWLGRAYAMKKDYLNASDAWEHAIELDSAYAFKDMEKDIGFYWGVYFNAGALCFNEKEWDKAIERFKRAIELEPDSFSAHFYLAQAYLQGGEEALAESTLMEIVEHSPQTEWIAKAAEILVNRYTREKRWDEALSILRKWIAIDTSGDAHYFMGVIYANKYNDTQDKEYADSAIVYFEESLKLNPDNSDTYYNLGNLYAQLKQYDKAIEEFEKATELNPNDEEAWYLLAVMCIQAESYEKALDAISKAIEINPNKAEYYTVRSGIHWKLGNKEASIQDMNKAKELGGE